MYSSEKVRLSQYIAEFDEVDRCFEFFSRNRNTALPDNPMSL